ncbi:MAG: hypothetical protein AAF628_15420 [Planctomycetota bacterium]
MPGRLQVVHYRGRGRVMGVHLSGAVFEWDGTVWTPVTAPGGPPQALGVAYDSMRDRLVVFAGPDMYEWNGASWQQIPAVGAIAGSGRLAMVYDSVRQQPPAGTFELDAHEFGVVDMTLGDVFTADRPLALFPGRVGRRLRVLRPTGRFLGNRTVLAHC